MSGTYQGHRWANVFYLELTGTGITAADLNTLATDIATQWNTNFGNLCLPSTILTEVKIVYVPSVGNEVVGVATVSHAGTNTGTDVENAASCSVINWNISAYYRGGHPRWYLPGISQAHVSNGSDIDSTFASNIASGANSFRTGVNGFTTTNISGVSFGTLSFASGNVWRGTPLFRPFTGATTRLKLGSQRRRILS